MLNLIPLTFLLLLQTPARPAFSCFSYVDGQLMASACEPEFTNPSAGKHRVAVDAQPLALGIEYRCKGPSTVQVRIEPFAITMDVRELKDGVWHSRGVGKVEWDANGVINLSSLPELGGECTSAKGFSLQRAPNRREHWDHPLPSHGLGG